MEGPTIQSEKMVLVIVWNPAGFHITTLFGKGCKFNISHYTTEVLSPLAEWHRNQVGASDRKMIVQTGDSHPHTNLFDVPE
jgi:hypothetical protein